MGAERLKKLKIGLIVKTVFVNLPPYYSTNVLTGDVPTAPIPVEEPPGIITATPPQASTQVTAPQVLSTTAISSSISSPSLPPSILTPPPTVESLSPESVNARSLSNL